jgi:hypothetical protein
MLAQAGRRENRSAAAPVNATSQWVWGNPALREDGANARNTLVGYLIHHGASIFWGVLHARVWGMRREAKRLRPALAGAGAAATIAYLVDYRLTPRRLTPGFEHRLSTAARVAVYGCFALGLALGSMAVGGARAGRLKPLPRPAPDRGRFPAHRPPRPPGN